jgi:hypothetical protein
MRLVVFGHAFTRISARVYSYLNTRLLAFGHAFTVFGHAFIVFGHIFTTRVFFRFCIPHGIDVLLLQIQICRCKANRTAQALCGCREPGITFSLCFVKY